MSNTIQSVHTKTYTHICTKPSLERNINIRSFLTGVLLGEMNGEEEVKIMTYAAKFITRYLLLSEVSRLSVFYLVSQGKPSLGSRLCSPLPSCRDNGLSCSHSLNRVLGSLRRPLKIQYYTHWINVSRHGNSAQKNTSRDK